MVNDDSAMEKRTKLTQNDEINLAVMARDITYLKKGIDDIKATVAKDYVLQAEFQPVQRLVYGLVSIILLAVVGALMALVLKR